MDRETITALLQPFTTLSPEQINKTSTYIDILLKWNARMNLTGVRRPEEIGTRHFGESFFVAAHLLPDASPLEAIDIGSGAGFPGLPLAIFAPDLRIILIEANARKATFLSEVISALDLKNARVFSGRAETYGEKADLVTMRAVEKFEGSLPVALRLVRDGGRVGLMIGKPQQAIARALAPELAWSQPAVIPGSESRVLVVGTKIVKVGEK